MPIDPASLNRHVTAQIAHYAVTCRNEFGNSADKTFLGSWRVTKALLNAIDGGVVNFGGGTLVVTKASFTVQPNAQESIEVRQADGNFVSYSIASIEGGEDELSGELIIMLEPAAAE